MTAAKTADLLSRLDKIASTLEASVDGMTHDGYLTAEGSNAAHAMQQIRGAMESLRCNLPPGHPAIDLY
jgi:hypothetical protein